MYPPISSSPHAASRWPHYFHPRLRLPAAAANKAQPANRTTRPKVVATGAVLGVAYPNPTQAETHISYLLPPAAATAELSFVDLLTGQIRLAIPLKTSDDSEAHTVQVPHLPAGQYMYRLLVNGQPVAVPQRLVTLP